MKNKEKKEVIKEAIKKSEIEKAREVLQREEQKKVELFMADYKTVCIKHGMELVANPKVEWSVTPIQK
jgi:uncharacterized protein YqiB (DUF1249 family)